MKQQSIKLAVALGMIISMAFVPKPATKLLVGKWQAKIPDGTVLAAIFRPNGSFTGKINGKVFVLGKYWGTKDTLYFADNGCSGKTGIYTADFKGDSMQLHLMQDSCTDRAHADDGLVMKRMK